jgi:hypothetical protein
LPAPACLAVAVSPNGGVQLVHHHAGRIIFWSQLTYSCVVAKWSASRLARMPSRLVNGIHNHRRSAIFHSKTPVLYALASAKSGFQHGCCTEKRENSPGFQRENPFW